jgi:hypothetical protein
LYRCSFFHLKTHEKMKQFEKSEQNLRINSKVLILKFRALYMLPDANSWRGLLPPLSCPPCTAAIDAFQRTALCGTLRVLGHYGRKRTCSKRPSARADCVVSGGFHAASQLLLRSHAHCRSILYSQPQLPRAIAGRSCAIAHGGGGGRVQDELKFMNFLTF